MRAEKNPIVDRGCIYLKTAYSLSRVNTAGWIEFKSDTVRMSCRIILCVVLATAPCVNSKQM